MKNDFSDLREILYAQLDRLSDDKNVLNDEVNRAKAMASLGIVILGTAKVEYNWATFNAKPKRNEEDEITPPKITRPPAEYSNKQHND